MVYGKLHFYKFGSDFLMNRKKKLNSILKKKQKQKNAKLSTKSKPQYVSKAEREKLALEEQATTDIQDAGE